MAKPGYCLILKNSTANFADASTSYLWQTTNSSSSQSRIPIPITGTIKKIVVSFVNSGTLGTSETGSLYLNKNGAASQTLLSSSVKNDTSNTTYTFTGLSIAVTSSDYINIQFSTPTWVTNPTNVNMSASIFIE